MNNLTSQLSEVFALYDTLKLLQDYVNNVSKNDKEKNIEIYSDSDFVMVQFTTKLTDVKNCDELTSFTKKLLNQLRNSGGLKIKICKIDNSIEKFHEILHLLSREYLQDPELIQLMKEALAIENPKPKSTPKKRSSAKKKIIT